MDISDPYVAYCLDEACAYIAEMMERRELPKFDRPKAERHGKNWTTNADVIHEILKETKQK